MQVVSTVVMCRIAGCVGDFYALGLCQKHYSQRRRFGDDFELKPIKAYRPAGSGTIKNGYLIKQDGGQYKSEHVHLAEKALGGVLPYGAEVHHVDLNRLNNAPSNLVICPSHAYHALLHQRQRAMDACGNPNWLKCRYCKSYSPPSEMYICPRGLGNHRECQKLYKRQRKQKAST